MSSISPQALGKISAPPGAGDVVFKDECSFTFTTPESDGGLFTSLTAPFQSFSRDFAVRNFAATGEAVYLHQKWTKKAEEEANDEDKPAAEAQPPPTKMAIGVEGGFDVDMGQGPQYDKTYHIAVFADSDTPPRMVPFPGGDGDGDESLPEGVRACAQAIIDHLDAGQQEDMKQWQDTREVSRFAFDLVQLNNGKKISSDPSTWRCEESGMTTNLWLNLSDGHIGSGRRNWDGSGGTGAAKRHYEETGKQFPLVVKLGTITAQGADVYSYASDEDDMVEDPLLAQHLAHWGIDIMTMEKTEKTMDELNVDINLRYDFSRVLESDKELVPRKGPGFTGLKNLGNSCYMNSTLQVLLSVPELRERYQPASDEELYAQTRQRGAASSAAEDLLTQLGKLVAALYTDKYGPEPPAPAPRMLRKLVSKGHAEFSSSRQQDAEEYLQYFLEQLRRAEHAAGSDHKTVETLFSFALEERLQDEQSGRVRYSRVDGNTTLALPIPVAQGGSKSEEQEDDNKEEEEEAAEPAAKKVKPSRKPVVAFDQCLDAWASPQHMEGFLSPVTKQRGVATKVQRFAWFPPYLFVQMRRYVVGENWLPKKLDVSCTVPHKLDLSSLRSPGKQDDEEELPADAVAADAAPAFVPDAALVTQLVSMGFPENGCKRAAKATNNAPADVTMNWILEHMGDPDFNDPLPAEGDGQEQVSAEALAMVTAMGFSEAQAKQGLKATGGNIERAVEWLFNHPDGADPDQGKQNEDVADEKQLDDGKGVYELQGFITHLGPNTHSGHYVCHLIKDQDDVVLFNDEKVATSQEPPLDAGYVYLFKRVE